MLSLFRGLPALAMLAGVDPEHSRLILPEIEVLPRVDLAADSFLEVGVGDAAVLVPVELLVDTLEGGVGHVQAPVVQVEVQLLGVDAA